MTTVSQCILCGGPGPLTKEDISPVWLRKSIVEQLRKRDELPDQLPPRHVIKICGSCNGSLNQRLESEASNLLPPYFRGHTGVIPEHSHRLMASWIAKLMFLGTLNSWRPGKWGLEQARQAMAPILEDGSLPHGLHVRVGFVDPSEHKRGLAGVAPVTQMPRFEFYSLSIIGVFAWEALLLGERHLDSYIAWADENAEWMTRLWPSPGLGVELPARTLSPVQVDQLRSLLLRSRNAAELLPEVVHRRFPAEPSGWREWHPSR